jgi:hypothetical protein
MLKTTGPDDVRAAVANLSEVVVDKGRREPASCGTKRFHLNLPVDAYLELERIAEARHTNVGELVRRFIKLGFIAVTIEDDPSSALIIKKGKEVTQIRLL